MERDEPKTGIDHPKHEEGHQLQPGLLPKLSALIAPEHEQSQSEPLPTIDSVIAQEHEQSQTEPLSTIDSVITQEYEGEDQPPVKPWSMIDGPALPQHDEGHQPQPELTPIMGGLKPPDHEDKTQPQLEPSPRIQMIDSMTQTEYEKESQFPFDAFPLLANQGRLSSGPQENKESQSQSELPLQNDLETQRPPSRSGTDASASSTEISIPEHRDENMHMHVSHQSIPTYRFSEKTPGLRSCKSMPGVRSGHYMPKRSRDRCMSEPRTSKEYAELRGAESASALLAIKYMPGRRSAQQVVEVRGGDDRRPTLEEAEDTRGHQPTQEPHSIVDETPEQQHAQGSQDIAGQPSSSGPSRVAPRSNGNLENGYPYYPPPSGEDEPPAHRPRLTVVHIPALPLHTVIYDILDSIGKPGRVRACIQIPSAPDWAQVEFFHEESAFNLMRSIYANRGTLNIRGKAVYGITLRASDRPLLLEGLNATRGLRIRGPPDVTTVAIFERMWSDIMVWDLEWGHQVGPGEVVFIFIDFDRETMPALYRVTGPGSPYSVTWEPDPHS